MSKKYYRNEHGGLTLPYCNIMRVCVGSHMCTQCKHHKDYTISYVECGYEDVRDYLTVESEV